MICSAQGRVQLGGHGPGAAGPIMAESGGRRFSRLKDLHGNRYQHEPVPSAPPQPLGSSGPSPAAARHVSRTGR
jgi:hypothetical protein